MTPAASSRAAIDAAISRGFRRSRFASTSATFEA
jgi:hypothetical protein